MPAAARRRFSCSRAKREQIESTFGGPLDWQDLPEKIGARICSDLAGGWRTPEADWPDLQDRMVATAVRLESALRQPVEALRV